MDISHFTLNTATDSSSAELSDSSIMHYIESICFFESSMASLIVIVSVFYSDLSVQETARDAAGRLSGSLEGAI